MALWYKVAWIPPLFDALNIIAPNRSKSSDGTIGDTAHQGSTSGHNPDDTPGSKPEREDADTKPEVRAADVTTQLNSSITMEMVIQSILATPSERDRLIYIIYNRRIWRKSNGWKQETYTGSDPHITHAHLSGDPAYDEDSRPWNSILRLGGTMSVPDVVHNNTHDRIVALQTGADYNGQAEPVLYGQLASLASQVSSNGSGISSLNTKVDTLLAGGVTQEMLNAAVVHALTQPEVLEALAPVIQENAFLGSQQAEQE